MKVKFWGCRGSLPTPEPYAAKYGGNTTCVEIRLEDGTCIIIDAGSGIRKLGNALLKEPDPPKDIYLFLTHTHWDHLMGFPFFVPAYIPGTRIHVRGGGRAKRYLQRALSAQMEAPNFPVDFKTMKAKFDFTKGNPSGQTIGSAHLTPVPLSHPNGGWGCIIEEAGKSFVFLTDNELGHVHEGGLRFSEYVSFCARADLLVHDAQYTTTEYKKKKTWGHSTYSEVTLLAISALCKRVGYFHHDPERSDREIDTFVAAERKRIEDEGRKLKCFAVAEGQSISL